MVIDAILNVFLNICIFFIDLLPTVEFETASIITDNFVTYLGMASYFVPLDTIILIFGIKVAMEVFKITLATVKLILEFIPFM